MFHGGRWRTAATWPLPQTRHQILYFSPEGKLTSAAPSAGAPPREYQYDPRHPVPTLGGSLCGIMELPPDTGDLDAMWKRFQNPVTRLRHLVTTGPCHQQESPAVFGAQPPYPLLADRPDVLVYQTDPLVQSMEVTGQVVVRLWISSSAVDTDFTVKLIDVVPPNADYPQGYHMNLVDSVLRARYRNSWEREELLEPGVVSPLTIRLPPTSNVFMPGHRLRIDISSSNFPRLDLNPNTGEPLGRHTHTIVATNRVHADARYPSQVELPVIPPET